MISPFNRQFLAYSQKKIFTLQFLRTCEFLAKKFSEFFVFSFYDFSTEQKISSIFAKKNFSFENFMDL